MATTQKRDSLSEEYTQFLDICAQFTIREAIGSIVRLKQSAPFYEITFLDPLLTMQFLGLLFTIFTAFWVVKFDNKEEEKKKEDYLSGGS
jgi:putative exporter of polyketide antibiotics